MSNVQSFFFVELILFFFFDLNIVIEYIENKQKR